MGTTNWYLITITPEEIMLNRATNKNSRNNKFERGKEGDCTSKNTDNSQ
jgi:hypothetical protein